MTKPMETIGGAEGTASTLAKLVADTTCDHDDPPPRQASIVSKYR